MHLVALLLISLFTCDDSASGVGDTFMSYDSDTHMIHFNMLYIPFESV